MKVAARSKDRRMEVWYVNVFACQVFLKGRSCRTGLHAEHTKQLTSGNPSLVSDFCCHYEAFLLLTNGLMITVITPLPVIFLLEVTEMTAS